MVCFSRPGFALLGAFLASPLPAATLVLGPRESPARLQEFLDADADTLVLTPRPGGWITGPLHLRRSHRTLILLPGAELRAAPGAFPGQGDCLLQLTDVKNVTILGYGARFVMRKREYVDGEWRHALSLRAAHGVNIEGLALDSSGGDGLYVDGWAPPAATYSSGIRVAHATMRGNRRQGVSVISAEDLLIEHSRMSETQGTPPQAGIDFEADREEHRFRNCRVRNSVFAGNRGPAAVVNLVKITGASAPTSIAFEDCLFDGARGGEGVTVRAYRGSVTRGDVSFERCAFRHPTAPTLLLRATVRDSARIRFEQCEFDGRGPTDLFAGGQPVLRFHESRPAGNAAGVHEGAMFRDVVIRAGGRNALGFTPLQGPPARDVRLRAHIADARAAEAPGGVSLDALASTPSWRPPPPMLTFLGARRGRVEVRLEAWSGDPVSARVGNGAWTKSARAAVVRLRAGETLRAVTRRAGGASDTLAWTAPEYLGREFAGR